MISYTKYVEQTSKKIKKKYIYIIQYIQPTLYNIVIYSTLPSNLQYS